ncbi:MAG: rRNA maturation RNase YbeY [Chitinophagales bacterium]
MAVSFSYQVPHFRVRGKKNIVQWILAVAFVERKEVEKIHFIFCNDEFIREINKEFLRHNTPTDIITFSESNENRITAEIYISVEHVRENSKYYDVPFCNELHRVIVHGILHCCGHDDKSQKEKRLMRKMEDEWLQRLSSFK